MPQRQLEGSALLVRDEAALVSAEVDGELVGLSVEKGICYGLNRVGTRIWGLLSRPRSVDDLCAQLVAEFDVEPAQCRHDVLALVEQLREEGLVSIATSA